MQYPSVGLPKGFLPLDEIKLSEVLFYYANIKIVDLNLSILASTPNDK